MASCSFHVTTKSVLFGYWFLSSLAIWQYASVALAADAFPPQAEPLYRDPQLVIDADGVPGETIVDLDISPDGERLAVSSGKQVRIYSLESGRLWKTLHGYREGDGISIGMIQKAKFSPSGRFLVVGITDNTELGSTRVYDLTRPEQLHRLVKGHTGCTKGVAFSPTGNLLATWSCDGTILLLDWDEKQGDGVELARFSKSDPNGTTSRLPFPYFGFPLNDDWLVFSEFNPQLLVFNTRQRRLLKSNFEWPPELRQFLLSPNREWLNWRDSCVGDFRLDNPQAIVMSGKSNSSDGPARYWVDAWNSVEGGLKRTHDGHGYFVTACCVKPKLNLCASADSLGRVRVWPLHSALDLRYAFAPANRPIYRVDWSADGNSLLFADKPHPQNLYWHNQFGTVNHRFDLQRRALTSEGLAKSSNDLQHGHVPLPREQIDETCLKLSCKANQLTAALRNVDTKQLETAVFNDWSDGDELYSFVVLPKKSPAVAAGPVLLGTRKGKLGQFTLRRGNDGNLHFELVRSFLGHANAVTSLAIAPNGKYFASGSLDGTIRVWLLDVPIPAGGVDFQHDGNYIELVPANSEAERIGLRKGDTILRLGEGSFYESRKRILDGTHTPGKLVPIVWKSEGEGPIKVRNYTLQTVPALSVAELILFLSRDDQWILFDQKGKYDSSPAGERYVGWHVNQQREEAALFFPVDRFREQLYRPRELSDRLADMGVTVPDGLSQDTSVHHESATPDFTSREDFEQYLPPRVRIISPEDRSVKNDAECQIRVEITTRSTLPIRSVVFRVNGIQPATRHRVITENVIGDEIALVVEQTVALSPGDNDLRINAAHERAVSNEQHLLLRRQGGETATRTDLPTLYVLAIGVSDYKNDNFDLRFAHKDASDFVEAWKRQQGLSYQKVESLLVTNREATTAKIRSAMKWLTDKTKNAPDGFAVVMFSGHGLFDEFDGWHFGAHDLDPQDLSNTSIPSVEIFDWLNRRVRCRKIVFADTCHAGAIPGNGFLFGRAVNRDGKDYWRGYGDIYLLASQPTEPSREDVAWQNGAYTEALLIALTSPKADTDHNGQLGLLELATFAEQETRRLTNHQQNPTVGIPPTVSIPMIATVSQQK